MKEWELLEKVEELDDKLNANENKRAASARLGISVAKAVSALSETVQKTIVRNGERFDDVSALMLKQAELIAEIAPLARAKAEPAPAPAQGEKGDRGDTGDRGPHGKTGDRGEKGEKGDKPDHEWQGTALRFEKPDGTWGESVDLKGPAGKRGGGGGGSAAPAPLKSPVMTWTAGVLTGVAYADGSTKTMSYTDGRLTRVDLARPGRPTTRKDLTYNGDGTVAAVEESEL